MIDRTSLRVALRTLGRHRGFTIVAVSSLAIAIALNTTMYSVLDAMLKPRVGAREPDQVFSLFYYTTTRKTPSTDQIERALLAGVSGTGAVTGATSSRYSWLGEPLAENGPYYRRVNPRFVWPNYFDFLGTRAIQGRTFRLDEDAALAPAVISDRLARHLFPQQSPIGQPFTIDGNGYTVIGVVVRGTSFGPLSDDVWLLRQAAMDPIPVTLIRFNRKVDRAKVDVELSLVAARLALAVGDNPANTRFAGFHTVVHVLKVTGTHYALVGAVIAVLLVACANLANLQLARGLTRVRELALRAAVGASRRQLVAHLLLESGVLAFAGLVLGLLATLWGVYIVRASLPREIAGLIVEPQTSWRVFAFAAGAALLCVVVAGLLPALRLSRVDPDTLLKAGAGTGANRAHRKRYGVMVIAQIGFALPVLIGAFVLLRTTLMLEETEFSSRAQYGYDTAPMIVSTLWFTNDTARRRPIHVADLAEEMVGRARAVPGIMDAAAEISLVPPNRRVTVDDDNGMVRELPAPQWTVKVVTPSYFRTFDRRIARGRDFHEGENDGTALIISPQTAQFIWGQRDPIGRLIKLGDVKSNEPWRRVVGVIADPRDTATIRRLDLTAGRAMGEVARVITPGDTVQTRRGALRRLVMYARARGSTQLAAVRLQRSLRSVKAPLVQTPAAIPLDEQYGRHTMRLRQRFMTGVFGVFGWLAIGLVAIGVYGIVAHSVGERRRELAVRISLGATNRNILHAILREGNVLILSGVALGLLLTYRSVWWLGQFIPEEAGHDALFMALVASLLFGVAVLAAFFPAWRATRIDPVEALRHE